MMSAFPLSSRNFSNETHRFVPFWRADNVNPLENFHFPDVQGAGMNVFNITEPGGCILKARKISPGFKMPKGCSSLHATSSTLPLFPPCEESPSMKYGEILLQRYGNHYSELNSRRSFNLKLMSTKKKVEKDANLYNDLGNILEQIKHSDDINIDIPPFLVKLVESLPSNWKEKYKHLDIYDDRPNHGRNGCIASFHPSNKSPFVTLLHSNGKMNNKLSVSKMSVKVPFDAQDCVQNVTADIEFDDKLLHMATVELHNTVYCGMRFAKSVRLGSFTANEFQELFAVSPTTENCYITDFAISPFLAGEFIYIDSNGLICSHDMENRVAVYENNRKRSQFKTKIDNWWSCEYGAHPRCALIGHKTGFYLRDFRQGMKRTINLLSASEVLMNDELIRCHVRSAGNCYRHWIGCDNALLLMDERFPDHPVLLWEHMMKVAPHLCHSAILSDRSEVLLLAGQNSNEIASFHIARNGGDAVSLAPPLYVSSPMDVANFLLSHGHSVNPLVEARLTAPLTGILTVPHKNGFIALQHTQLGDVFYQDFTRSTSDQGKSFRFNSDAPSGLVDEKGVKMASDWCNCVAQIVEKAEQRTAKLLNKKQRKVLPEHDMETAFKFLASAATTKKHNADCIVCCNCGICHEMHVNEPLPTCEKCGIHIDDARALSAAAKEGGITAGPVSAMKAKSQIQCFQQAKQIPANCLTALDKRLMSIWDYNIEMNEEEHGTSSQSPMKRKHWQELTENEDEDTLQNNYDHHLEEDTLLSLQQVESTQQHRMWNSPDIFEDETNNMPPCSQNFDFPNASQGFTLGESMDFSYPPISQWSNRSSKSHSTPKTKAKHTSGF